MLLLNTVDDGDNDEEDDDDDIEITWPTLLPIRLLTLPPTPLLLLAAFTKLSSLVSAKSDELMLDEMFEGGEYDDLLRLVEAAMLFEVEPVDALFSK